MSGYLSLCAFRQGLLPETCRSCAWWLTSGGAGLDDPVLPTSSPADRSVADRRRWMSTVESTWGMPGLLLEEGGIFSLVTPSSGAPGPTSTGGAPAPSIAASIHFAPSVSVPRLRDLPFDPLPEDSGFVFCLACAGSQPWYQSKRLLHKALMGLRHRKLFEVYAVASGDPSPHTAPGCRQPDGDICRFFPPAFLAANGFHVVEEREGLMLMRVDLGGLLTLISRVRVAARQLLDDEPAPSPAAWTRHETP